MHKQSIKGKIQLESYDDLLSGGVKHREGEITEMPLVNLHPFKNHPFKVLDDEHMAELVESIKEKGVLSPAIVRKREKGGYEIISGHRRKHACELAGLMTMPVIIKQMDDDEATILMVDANIQRENISPSERAFSIKMKMEALRHQGRRSDLMEKKLIETETTGHSDPKNTTGHDDPKIEFSQVDRRWSAEAIGQEEGLSASVVKRYIRLTNLIPGLLDRVDKGKIGFMQAVDLSFIEKPEQKTILAVINKTDRKMTARQAKQLREAAESGLLDEDSICDILIGKSAIIRTVTFSEKELSKYFPETMDSNDIKQFIIGLIEEWKEACK